VAFDRGAHEETTTKRGLAAAVGFAWAAALKSHGSAAGEPRDVEAVSGAIRVQVVLRDRQLRRRGAKLRVSRCLVRIKKPVQLNTTGPHAAGHFKLRQLAALHGLL
jgi:hypothetical protein